MASSDYDELVDYDLANEVSQPTSPTSAPEPVSVATVRLSDETSISALDTLADVTTGASRLSDTNDLPSTSMVVTRSQSRANTPTATTSQPPFSPPAPSPVSPPISPDVSPAMSGHADDEVDRTARVTVESLNKSFRAPQEFDDLDIQSNDRSTLKVVGLAPWFHKPAVQAADNHLEYYTDPSGYLPDQIHLGCTQAWTWQRVFCARDNDLYVSSDRLPSSIREDFNWLCYVGLRRLFCIEPIPSSVGVDLFVYRTRGEIPYVQALVSIPLATIEGWRGVTGVRQAAICFAKPLLRIEFRFLSKRSEYWLEQVADERYDRSLWNLAVPFQCPQARQMTRDARRRGFCRFPEAWQRV